MEGNLKTISPALLQQLLDTSDTPALSIYMPTHRFPTPVNMREDQIRMKNVIRQAKEACGAAGFSADTCAAIVQNIETETSQADFWRSMREGIAIFATPDTIHVIHMPIETDEHVAAGMSFELAPVLALQAANHRYMVLALAVHEPQLFVGDMYGIEQVETGFPRSPEEALNIDEMFINSNTIRGVASGNGNGRISSHGQGDSREAGNEERLQFFRIIDRMITEHKAYDAKMPLILAGIDSEVAEYRDISKHPMILDDHLAGSIGNMPTHDIFAKAWPIIETALIDREAEQAMERMQNMIGTGKASQDVTDITRAAKEGRIDTLILPIITLTRDTVADAMQPIKKLRMPDIMRDGSIADVIRLVASQGGRIIGIQDQMMTVPIAAVYRY